MTEITVDLKFKAESNEIQSNVQGPLQKAVSEYEKSLNDTTNQALNNASSTFSSPNTSSSQSSTFAKDATNLVIVGAGGAIGAGIGGTLGSVVPGLGTTAGAIAGGFIGSVIGQFVENMIAEVEEASRVNFANLGLSLQELFSTEVRDRIIEQANSTAFGLSDEALAESVILEEATRGRILSIQEVLAEKSPDALQFFKPERLEEINRIVEVLRGNVGGLTKDQGNLNNASEKTNQINQEQAISYANNATAVLENANNQSTLAEANKAVTDNFKEQADQVEQAEKTLGDLGGAAEDATDKANSLGNNLQTLATQNENVAESQDKVGKSLDDAKDKLDQANTTVGNLNPSLVNLAAANQNVAQSEDQVANAVDNASDAIENGGEKVNELTEETYKEELKLAA